MISPSLKTKAEFYLKYLCLHIPTRRVGTQGNRDANEFLAERFASFGFAIERQPFDCIDWTQGNVSLSLNGQQFQVQVGAFTLGYQVQAPLVVASTVEELASANVRDKILLLHGEIIREQLIPKNFPFYNPDKHKRLVSLLEMKMPLAVLTATGRNPETAGAVYPFPMIEDGDFDIPSAYMTEEKGMRLASHADEVAALVIEAERGPSNGVSQPGRPQRPRRSTGVHQRAHRCQRKHARRTGQRCGRGGIAPAGRAAARL